VAGAVRVLAQYALNTWIYQVWERGGIGWRRGGVMSCEYLDLFSMEHAGSAGAMAKRSEEFG
jgi:hypothetical protein